jgi:hypothetical protein
MGDDQALGLYPHKGPAVIPEGVHYPMSGLVTKARLLLPSSSPCVALAVDATA